MGKILQEFKTFAMRGNVIDMAVGVIIGGAFGKIVSSLVADVIMPLVGLLVGGINFSQLKWTIKPAVMDGDAVVSPEVLPPAQPTRAKAMMKVMDNARTVVKVFFITFLLLSMRLFAVNSFIIA